MQYATPALSEAQEHRIFGISCPSQMYDDMSYPFYRFSGLVGALGGGLSTLSGYNGLPSVLSGLDDSLSDVAARKKYPFELEKAIHNVMFIQHHMQRQDEFNAVSPAAD